MAQYNNPQTDALNLVQVDTIHRGWFTPRPTLNAEEGFLLEHYRGSQHINSFASNQLPSSGHAPDAKEGDTIFRLNLGPHTQLIEGTIRTWEGYSRPYRLLVVLQIGNPQQLLTLYRQNADPVGLAVRALKEAFQAYAERTIYEDISHLNLVAKAQSAFDREPGRCKAGLRVHEVHDPMLGPDSNYQPVMLRQLLPLEDSLTTKDGYVRAYKVQIELEVIDLYDYKKHELTGEKPLKLVQATIHGELQRYVHTLFYEDLIEIDLHTFLEQRAFAGFPRQARAGLRIVRTNNFWLGTDKTYQPIPLLHTLVINNKLKTIEGYERDYEVKVELQVVERLEYLNRSREGTNPLSLAQATIEGEILQFAGQQTYEVLNDETLLFKKVEHAFDKLSNHTTGSIGIKQVHYFSLQPSSDYVMARVLDIVGEIKTSDVRVCTYSMTVEVKISDAVTYVQLSREGTDPLNLVKEAILGAIEQLARGKDHDTVMKLEIAQAARDVFQQAPNATIGGLQIVQAHKAILNIDANIKVIEDIKHVRDVESSEIKAKSYLMYQAQEEEFKLKMMTENQEFDLTLIRQQTAEAQTVFDMRRNQMLALSQGQIDFWQKALEIATEELESGASTAEALNSMQTVIQNIQGNLSQITGKQDAQGYSQISRSQEQMRALKPGEDAQVVDAAKPKKKSWKEVGLTLMEVAVPSTLRTLIDDREIAVQIRKVEASSLARQAGLRVGDFLIELQDQEINTIDDIDNVLESIQNQCELRFVVTNTDGLTKEYSFHLTANNEE